MSIKPIPKLQLLLHYYNRRCAYCDIPVTRSTDPSSRAATIDHYRPKSLGGTNGLRNLRLACRGCNSVKADMPPHEWEELRSKQFPAPNFDQAKRVDRYKRRVALLARCAPRGPK